MASRATVIEGIVESIESATGREHFPPEEHNSNELTRGRSKCNQSLLTLDLMIQFIDREDHVVKREYTKQTRG